ncbi:exodeoxyribonuclease III [Neoehrlichia mikurensis]|uniref:Exodeoxyribonuclease III n=1 Tax=Neoehrlichia mikurensis TaxID=89586 RepID=A0A9Q9BSV2_9RICK|nr:exodeoxyribonuclease III [Neoehrlichia mikurensis]QXK91964.1 exodeoxyribonuclease III [Neoehrlichia mikurensis]QXK93178.1 exodeoxyribonuclease III [Neoehrlichia mikurensis]QXK93656.1 exodeoxyribonuclease III [Neoehrlichia mikurensis]UTO55387.1 exodeoxyribonuclease III [Neoehrlichia mikurensis]
MLKIATWNVNSIRKRLCHLCDYLIANDIDIILLQELKCTNELFPYMDLESLGYQCYVHGQKARNGVAIITKYKASNVRHNIFMINNIFIESSGSYNCDEARYIEAVIIYNDMKIRVASIYVPNGQDVNSEMFTYKLNFFDQLRFHMLSLLNKEEITIIGGDYNVAPEIIDVYCTLLDGKLCFHKDERAKFRSILNLGFFDAFRVINDNQKFSWWNYKNNAWNDNKGMRIDHLLLSPQAADKLLHCDINEQTRSLESPSDHAPVLCVLEL